MKKVSKLTCIVYGGGILLLAGTPLLPVKAELAPGCVQAMEYYSPSSTSGGPPNPSNFVVVKNECKRKVRVKAIVSGDGNNSRCKSLDSGDVFSHGYPHTRKLIKINNC
jgi:hypothetical protein